MKNKLSDLNDHLFVQLERLADENLKSEQLASEIKRGAAMVGVADQILRSAELRIAAAKIVAGHGKGDPMAYLPALEGRPLIEGAANGKTRA